MTKMNQKIYYQNNTSLIPKGHTCSHRLIPRIYFSITNSIKHAHCKNLNIHTYTHAHFKHSKSLLPCASPHWVAAVQLLVGILPDSLLCAWVYWGSFFFLLNINQNIHVILQNFSLLKVPFQCLQTCKL